MDKLFSIGFWSAVARFILRNRALIILSILAATVFLALQWKHMRFTYTESNLLPDDHPYNEEYQQFLNTFGEEGNLIIIGVKDSSLFQPATFAAWTQLSKKITTYDEVDLSLSVGDLKKLEKREDTAAFQLAPFIKDSTLTQQLLDRKSVV